MFARVGVLEMMIVAASMLGAIGPYRFGIMVSYVAGLQAGAPVG